MKDAVILHCGHLFCEDCISRWWSIHYLFFCTYLWLWMLQVRTGENLPIVQSLDPKRRSIHLLRYVYLMWDGILKYPLFFRWGNTDVCESVLKALRMPSACRDSQLKVSLCTNYLFLASCKQDDAGVCVRYRETEEHLLATLLFLLFAWPSWRNYLLCLCVLLWEEVLGGGECRGNTPCTQLLLPSGSRFHL